MDCNEAQAYITLAVDNRLSEEEQIALHCHIQQCAYCLDTYTSEFHIKQLLRSKVKTVPVPDQLKQNLNDFLSHPDKIPFYSDCDARDSIEGGNRHHTNRLISVWIMIGSLFLAAMYIILL